MGKQCASHTLYHRRARSIVGTARPATTPTRVDAPSDATRREALRARPRDAETTGEGAREGRAREDARGAIGRATEGRDAGRGARRAARDARRR